MSGRVVFDVNILVSAVLAPGGTPARAIAAAVEGRWTIARSPHIVDKFNEVLSRPRFDNLIANYDLNTFTTGYRAVSKEFTPDPSVAGVADDAEDDAVLGTAVAARADVIVTGDRGMLAIRVCRGIPIITGWEFLVLIDA